MIYLIPNKRGYLVKLVLLKRSYFRSQRKHYADALQVVAQLQEEFPDLGVAILADFPAA